MQILNGIPYIFKLAENYSADFILPKELCIKDEECKKIKQKIIQQIAFYQKNSVLKMKSVRK
jgi:hypothetical protein